MTIYLTPALRYRQAVVKARILAERDLRQYLAGEIEWLPCSKDREREIIMEEIGRAFGAGVAFAQTSGIRT